MGKHAGVFLTAGFPVPAPAPRRGSLPSPRAAPTDAAPPGMEELEKRGVQRGVCEHPPTQADFPVDSPRVVPTGEGLPGGRGLDHSSFSA